MIAFLQVLLKFFLIPLFQIPEQLSNSQFVLLVLATLLIAAGGYVINDIKDISIDKINKPDKQVVSKKISLSNAKIVYYLLSLSGLIMGAYLSFIKQNVLAFIGFLVPFILLYYYAIRAKKQFLIGNVLVSLLIVFSLLIVVVFELELLENNQLVNIIFAISLYTFFLNLAREIVKDSEDVIGDKAHGVQSIPVKYGFKGTAVSVQICIGILLLFTFAIGLLQYKTQPALVIYLVTGLMSGLLLFLSQLQKATKAADYAKLSILLKLLMVVGIISLLFVKPLI
jgi:4-hydroxybenzoate polyprenyltransferase